MDYKEKQKLYKRLNKERGSILWMSRVPGDIKGRTYTKEQKELDKQFEQIEQTNEEQKKDEE